MSDEKPYMWLATVRWGGSLVNLVGRDLRTLATGAINAFRFPPRVREELEWLINEELSKPDRVIDYLAPFEVPFGNLKVSISFDHADEVV